MASTFVSSGRPDPTKNTVGKTDMRLTRQTSAYKAKDPPVRHQKALPPAVFRHLISSAKTRREKARALLTSCALFIAGRSCEYTEVPQNEQKTRPLRTCDIRFLVGAREIPHSSNEIFHAKTVIVGFGPQKSGFYDDEVPMDRNNDPILNPITLWAKVITRIQSYPKFDPKWPIYTYYDEKTKRFTPIKSREIQKDIKTAVATIGKDTLGFGPADVGTHSVRSSLAMQLYLQRVPHYTIMLIGRWRSDAFLSYIEKQCREFTIGMSQTMLNLNTFYQLPNQTRLLTEPPTDTKKKTQHDTANSKHFVHYGRLNATRSRRHG